MNDQVPQSVIPSSLIPRVKNILLQPNSEWDVIDAEPATIGEIYKKYVFILALIAPLCGLIGALVFGYSAFGITVRPSVTGAISTAVVQFIVALAGTYVFALIIDFLAPKFDATPNRVQAFKVAAYASTASWVAGVFAIIPSLAWLSILGLYSLYLLYLGLPKLMKAPVDKAMTYTVVAVLVAIVMFFLIGMITTTISARFAQVNIASSAVEGAVSVPGLGSVDLGKLDAASKQIEAATNGGVTAGNGAVAPDQLQALLPANLAGYTRTEISSSAANAGGLGGSHAEAKFTKGDSNISLEVTDMAAAGALAALGGALNVQSSKQTATGYEKTGKVDGRMTTEEWDNQSNSGKYSVLVADRFMTQADGNGVTMDELKAAIAAIGIDRLEALAKK